jgi:L-rhamnose mutarotase
MQRFAAVTRVHPEKLEQYKALHAKPWAGVLETLKKAGIQNYSIFIHGDLLFSYLEFTGTDWEAANQIIAADPETQAWWQLTDPCQNPFPSAQGNAKWSDMESIFFMP